MKSKKNLILTLLIVLCMLPVFRVSNAMTLNEKALTEASKCEEGDIVCITKILTTEFYSEHSIYTNSTQNKSKNISYKMIAPDTLETILNIYSGMYYYNDNMIFNPEFFTKFLDPYFAVQLPSDAYIDEGSISMRVQFYVAPKGMDIETVKKNNSNWKWAMENCDRKEYILPVDKTQKNRILDVINIMYPPASGFKWDLMKFEFPNDFSLPSDKVFFNLQLILTYHMKVNNQPSKLTYLGSLGKMKFGPITDMNIFNMNKKHPEYRPDVDFVGEYGSSKGRISYVIENYPITELHWLCNCTDKDRTFRLNASALDWGLSEFTFNKVYYEQGEIKLGDLIGDNGATITIEKPDGSEKTEENTTYNYENCRCSEIITYSKKTVKSNAKPAILKITAQDINEPAVKTEADVVLIQGTNKIYPVLNVHNDGTNLKLSWYAPFAQKYILYYLPVGGNQVKQLDLGKLESAVVASSQIRPLYIAIAACYDDGKCDISNIEKTH